MKILFVASVLTLSIGTYSLFSFMNLSNSFQNSTQGFSVDPSDRGCCSYHHGEAYCSGGQVVCSDGAISSCRC